ncbi:MAG TPA: ATP-binding protein [Candidatus Polarisedimenticolia bacterium]|nr:ATP-binding protein [Candidatus Polarisedimenticolia bacterium]
MERDASPPKPGTAPSPGAPPGDYGNGRGSTVDGLKAANAALRARLDEAEETIRAIQQGAVDAFVLEELGRHRVYTLEGGDRPYQVFVEQMQQGVATLHLDGTVMYGNRRLAEMLKTPRESLIGTSLRGFVAELDKPLYDDLLKQGQGRSARGEIRLRPAEGEEFPAYLTLSLLPGESMVGLFVTDLTVQKHHEALAAAQEALREADRRKNEFIAMLAHELRNPLAPIRNAAGILKRTADDPKMVEEIGGMLERQIGLMVRLVDDLLDVSRITRNRVELRRQRLELASVLEQAVESIRPLCRKARHHITVALPPEPVYLDADPVRLTQVFTNLLDNACKYMEPGGRVRLSAEVTPARDDAPGEVVVRVRDEGIGIPAEALSRIFEMFAQIDTSLERRNAGLGIGLSLVNSLVELHGGKVEARSEGKGQGSEFVVRLPTVAEGCDGLSAQEGEKSMKRYRMLVVDDNRDSAESLALLLKLTGHDTHTALDGEAAIRAAAENQPDVVLLDIGMPKLNGYDACKRIRSEPWGRDMILIAQTGWGQDDDRRRTEEAGFDGHVVKPVDPEDLIRMVARLSTARRPEQQS